MDHSPHPYPASLTPLTVQRLWTEITEHCDLCLIYQDQDGEEATWWWRCQPIFGTPTVVLYLADNHFDVLCEGLFASKLEALAHAQLHTDAVAADCAAFLQQEKK